VAGGAAALLLAEPARMLPSALAWSRDEPPPAPARAAAPAAPAPADGWARPYGQDARGAPSDIKALAVTQLVIPAHAPDCDTDLQALASPNGEPWPAQSGYVDGFPIGNRGDEMQVTINNSANSSPVFVKLYDLERRANVRHAYVQAGGTLTLDRLAAGKYEVRYQNIVIGASRADCAGARPAPLRQAAAEPGL
jgi:hypothetical protein